MAQVILSRQNFAVSVELKMHRDRKFNFKLSLVISGLGLMVSSLIVPSQVLAADQFSAEVLLKVKDNQYTQGIEYEPTSIVLPENEFCPANNCQFGISDGELRSDTYSSDLRHFKGTLKVARQEGDVKITKLYPFNSALSISEIRETNGRTVEFLGGDITFGRDAFNPDFKYQITNGTFTLENNKASLFLAGNSS